MSKATFKVSVTITIEVDREAYNNEYGTQATAEEIREHIKGEAVTATESAFRNIESIKVADWR